METPVKVLRAGLSIGFDFAAGPTYEKMTVVGERGMAADQVIPTTTNGDTFQLFNGPFREVGKQGQILRGEAMGLRGAVAAEVSAIATFRGQPKEGAMLERLRQGKALAAKAQIAVSEGRSAEASTLVAQMRDLRAGVSKEKQALNRTAHSW
jgi:hypothetical protein